MIDGHTRLYGLLGMPVGHSLSPALHNAAFSHFGINACYVPLPVAPSDISAAISAIKAFGFGGVNVTVPHKTTVIPFLDEIRGDAAALGAVNVISVEDGRLIGHNTDSTGFRRMIETHPVDFAGKPVAIIGAGGAAPAIVSAAAALGASDIVIVNRTLEKAQALIPLAQGVKNTTAISLSSQSVDSFIKNSIIIINATSLGLHSVDPLPVPVHLLTARHTVIDLIYKPPETPLLQAAGKRGAAIINGYGMLVYQALESFKIWTGLTPPASIMWDAGLGAFPD